MNIEIPAPRDADGREIDIEECWEMRTDGWTKLRCLEWRFCCGPGRVEDGEWEAETIDADGYVDYYSPAMLHIVPPDSLKRLAQDLKALAECVDDDVTSREVKNAITSYASMRGIDQNTCLTIRFMLLDIAKRVAALAEKEGGCE